MGDRWGRVWEALQVAAFVGGLALMAVAPYYATWCLIGLAVVAGSYEVFVKRRRGGRNRA